MAAEIPSICGTREADAFHPFADWTTASYEAEMPTYIERNYDSALDLVRPLPPALRLLRLGALRRLGGQVRRFFDDERLQRVFSFQSLYAGLAPQRALALYAVITYMDTINGVVVADGGMQSLPAALARAAEHGGARFRYCAPVERIVTARDDGGPVAGVRLAGGEL